jgi:para-aminobenzoate synthetase component 1
MRATNPEQVDAAASIQAVDYHSGVVRFGSIAADPGAVWLDSGNAGFSHANYEIIASNPSQTARVDAVAADGSYIIHDVAAGRSDIFDQIQKLHCPSKEPALGHLPFYGGVLGYLGYDLNRSLERLTPQPPCPLAFPVAWLGYYPWALVQDIATQKAWLVADSAASLEPAKRWLENMDRQHSVSTEFQLEGDWLASNSALQYSQSVAKIQQFIHAGDCYQVNLAQHFKARYSGHPWNAYRQLRQQLPAPFSAFINTGHGCLLSHSPERFLSIANQHISTSPIKGTRPRGQTTEADAHYARELLNSAKDRAENLMIVDLLRNDLGRSCLPGSITADALFTLESYANVHHLVSTVSGKLRSNVTALEALRSAFPGGSITGAPKIRAMDIINALEPVSRSAYCGSVFYYSNHGHFDSNIAIRSLIADGSDMHCWGGGGIVADSDPQQEYAESLNKIEILLQALSNMTI